MNKNASSLARRYILDHPSVRDCLDRGLINTAALAREICEQLGLTESIDAVQAACRRYQLKARVREANEARIGEVVSAAKIQIRTRVLVATVDKARNSERFDELLSKVRSKREEINLIDGQLTTTIITSEYFAEFIRDKFRSSLIRLQPGLVQISMLMPEEIEVVPGVVAHIYGLLAQHGINLREEMSCWTELMLIIEQKDLDTAVRLLTPVSKL